MRRIAVAFVSWALVTGCACLGAWLILGVLTTSMAIVAACAALVALPPGLDPAIQIKERQRRGR